MFSFLSFHFSNFPSDWCRISYPLALAAPVGGVLAFLLSPVVVWGLCSTIPGWPLLPGLVSFVKGEACSPPPRSSQPPVKSGAPLSPEGDLPLGKSHDGGGGACGASPPTRTQNPGASTCVGKNVGALRPSWGAELGKCGINIHHRYSSSFCPHFLPLRNSSFGRPTCGEEAMESLGGRWRHSSGFGERPKSCPSRHGRLQGAFVHSCFFFC